jgi:plastocyanin
MKHSPLRRLTTALLVSAIFVLSAAYSAPPSVEIEIHNHLFEPDVIRIPAGTKIRLVIHNRDRTPEEFESLQLNRKKIIMGDNTAAIFIGPLVPGDYTFFGEFNPDTALGKIIVEENTDAR